MPPEMEPTKSVTGRLVGAENVLCMDERVPIGGPCPGRMPRPRRGPPRPCISLRLVLLRDIYEWCATGIWAWYVRLGAVAWEKSEGDGGKMVGVWPLRPPKQTRRRSRARSHAGYIMSASGPGGAYIVITQVYAASITVHINLY